MSARRLRALLALTLLAPALPLRAQDVGPEPGSDDGFSGVPIVAYFPDTGLVVGGYGVYHFRFAGQPASEPASTVPVLAAVTTDKDLGVEITPELFLPGKDFWLLGDFTARLVPESSYFGMGNETGLQDEETYRSIQIGIETEWRRRFVGSLYLGVVQSLLWRANDDFEAGGLLGTTRPPGVNGGTTSGIGPELAYDTRDNTFAPHRGSFVVLAVPLHGPYAASDFRFTRVTLDARTYLSISGAHVLGLRGLLDVVIGTAPFDRLPELASSTALRGYLRGRFRDQQALSFEVEYRFPLVWRFGGAVFAGAGQVMRDLDDLTLRRFHAAGGVGVRFALVPEERINLRADVAIADKARVYFAPGEAW